MEKDIDEVLREINEASMEIPFENSQFQTDKFVVQGQIVPTRAYRAILLRLNNRIRALNEAKYNLAKEDIDIEELNFKIGQEKAKVSPNTFDLRRWDLDVSQKLENREYTKKLVHDALVEVNHLYNLFQKFPRYTREQFESGEKAYFIASLGRQVNGFQGASASLMDMEEVKIPDSPLLNLDTSLKNIVDSVNQAELMGVTMKPLIAEKAQ